MRERKAPRAKYRVGTVVSSAGRLRVPALSHVSRLKAARLRAGLTLKEVARRAGLALMSVWRIEEGRQGVSPATALRLEKLFRAK